MENNINVLKRLIELYLKKDFKNLFKLIRENPGLKYSLCSLVCEKRRLWAKEIKKSFKASGDLKEDILKIYKLYFNIEVPKDGNIVFYDGTVLIIDWFNDCQVLKALVENNMDTRVYCKEIYEKPVQVLLDELLPYKVFFTRNYKLIRPYHSTCREIFVKIGAESLPELKDKNKIKD